VERGTDRMAASVPERWPNRQHELQLAWVIGRAAWFHSPDLV
jgi:hypothetical protein